MQFFLSETWQDKHTSVKLLRAQTFQAKLTPTCAPSKGRRPKKLFFWEISPKCGWVIPKQGPNPSKPPKSPWNRLFRPEFHLSISQISQKPWSGWAGKYIWKKSPKKRVFLYAFPKLWEFICTGNHHFWVKQECFWVALVLKFLKCIEIGKVQYVICHEWSVIIHGISHIDHQQAPKESMEHK